MLIIKELKSYLYKFFMSGLLILVISGCAQPSYKSDEFYEYKLKKHQVFYPDYHPGDFCARLDQDSLNDISKECLNYCEPENKCPTIRSTLPEAHRCRERVYKEKTDCIRNCWEEKYRLLSIAKHIEGGYYSDGSYYASYHNCDRLDTGCGNSGSSYWFWNMYSPFRIRNIHPTRKTYQKTKWQKDRDECMEITDEITKETFFGRNCGNIGCIEYYQNCLKEKGYTLKGKVGQ